MQKYKIAIISMLALTIPVSLYTVSAANNSIPGQGLYALDNQLYEITKAYMTSTQGDKGKAIALKAELEENLREIEAFQATKNRSINDYKTAYDSFTKKYQELDKLEKKYKDDDNFVDLDLSRSLIKDASQYYAISYPFLGEIKNDPALYNLVFESLNTVTDYAYEINSQMNYNEGVTEDMDPKTKAKTLLDQAFSDYNDLVDINTFGIQLNEDQKQKTTDSIDIIAGYYEEANALFDNGDFDEVAKLSNKIIEEKENIFTILDLDEEIDGFNNIMTLDFMKIEKSISDAEDVLNNAKNPSKSKQVDLKNAKKYFERAQLKTKLINLLIAENQSEDIQATKDSILEDINQVLSLTANIIANPETPVQINYQYNQIVDNSDDDQQVVTPAPTAIPTVEATPSITPEPTPEEIPTPQPTEDEDDDDDDFEYENEYEDDEDEDNHREEEDRENDD